MSALFNSCRTNITIISAGSTPENGYKIKLIYEDDGKNKGKGGIYLAFK